jgi:hypothetical protein
MTDMCTFREMGMPVNLAITMQRMKAPSFMNLEDTFDSKAVELIGTSASPDKIRLLARRLLLSGSVMRPNASKAAVTREDMRRSNNEDV